MLPLACGSVVDAYVPTRAISYVYFRSHSSSYSDIEFGTRVDGQMLKYIPLAYLEHLFLLPLRVIWYQLLVLLE